ncbi:DUF1304 domain-containing protein [Neolewinella antarctica]|uniref:Membrane protein n=1 Tax=Neolewinella antarctica TaxID=442734 RepID=A0ABX0XHV5_9BACT|nr:DUF1304 domain-containing protein [Neolewinella antarctica]NJC28446.1 putative membrane protein [Neolewinella antarctica]
MSILAQFMVALVALIHLCIFWIEAFAWETAGPKAFPSMPRALFGSTKVMAANQGVYNGFLAAGLIWSLLIQNAAWSANVGLFFLACVAVAGVVGALTVDRKILFIQMVPAVVGIALILLR